MTTLYAVYKDTLFWISVRKDSVQGRTWWPTSVSTPASESLRVNSAARVLCRRATWIITCWHTRRPVLTAAPRAARHSRHQCDCVSTALSTPVSSHTIATCAAGSFGSGARWKSTTAYTRAPCRSLASTAESHFVLKVMYFFVYLFVSYLLTFNQSHKPVIKMLSNTVWWTHE